MPRKDPTQPTPKPGRPRKALTLTEALRRNSTNDQLAKNIIRLADGGDVQACKLWAQYEQSPEAITRVIDESEGEVGYENLPSEDLDTAVEKLKQELGIRSKEVPAPEAPVGTADTTLQA